jgi:U3 small nucleolar RNA-associated protein 14
MPPRISRGSIQNSKPKSSAPAARRPKKSAKRALDAFAIAGHEAPERTKIARHRLGEADLSSHHKRAREEDEDDEEDEDEERKRRKQRKGDESPDEGSDSEGNTWTMGHVAEDDDSDIDSDEAFGESDEENFEGWTFRGSSGHTAGKNRRVQKNTEEGDMGGEVDLDEGDSADSEGEEDEDDLGDDAIDLATALDQYEESEEKLKSKKSNKKKPDKKKAPKFSASESSEDDDMAADGSSDISSEEDDPHKMAQLKNLILSLPEEKENREKVSRKADVHESAAPSEFGVFRKVDLASFKPRITDPEKKKSLKLLQDDLKPSKRNDIARKLDAPLPKRQQDKLNRAAANEKTNEALGRWVDTVKQNRRSEHISFPLKHPNAGLSMGESRLMPTTTVAPANDLESTIQSILQQSGLSNGKDDEDQIQKWEELQTNKLPLEEVMKRRAQLRKERELMFREEVRAKRVKKIKSKAYRRVHRKERERLMEKERKLLRGDGVDVSEDEREHNDRRRAEERMGAKHRESKWAKGVKKSGKAAWDDDARAGVTDMARRNEELRRRIEGKDVRDDDDDDSDFSSEGDDDDAEDGDRALQKQLGRLDKSSISTGNSKLGSMAFMQKAEAARKARNDEDIERIRRELAGEETNSEDEDENSTHKGRRKFAPGNKTVLPAIQINRSEFEEKPGSDEETEGVKSVTIQGLEPTNGTSNGAFKTNGKAMTSKQNPFLMPSTKDKKKGTRVQDSDTLVNAFDTVAAVQPQNKSETQFASKTSKPASESTVDDKSQPQYSAPDADGWQTVTYKKGSHNKEDDDIENEGIDLDVVLRNQALTAKGFAGDNVEADFILEKTAQVADEASKEITTHLPGWGAWTGDGLSAAAKRHKGAKTVTKQDGTRPDRRKDKNKDKVIINERKVKKNGKFLASSLPFPFENKEQYERSLRLPMGGEWRTKSSFQEATKPRVLVKQGVIKAMAKPMV